MEELWRDIPRYESKYQVSSEGRVRSLPRNGTGKTIKFMKITAMQTYPAVYLGTGVRNQLLRVQIDQAMVLAFFQLTLREGQYLNVIHLDGSTCNNQLTNLDYEIIDFNDSSSSEKWKTVTDYPDYKVSNYGRIWSSIHNLIMRPSHEADGYRRVELYKEGKLKSFAVHRLVATAFISNPENKPQVNHKDGNKSNNHADNLEWCTGSENVRHAYSNNLISPMSEEGLKRRIEASRKMLKEHCNIPIICVNTGQEFESMHHAALFYNVDDTTIQGIVRGVTKKSRKLPGLEFRFKDPAVTCRSSHKNNKEVRNVRSNHNNRI